MKQKRPDKVQTHQVRAVVGPGLVRTLFAHQRMAGDVIRIGNRREVNR